MRARFWKCNLCSYLECANVASDFLLFSSQKHLLQLIIYAKVASVLFLAGDNVKQNAKLLRVLCVNYFGVKCACANQMLDFAQAQPTCINKCWLTRYSQNENKSKSGVEYSYVLCQVKKRRKKKHFLRQEIPLFKIMTVKETIYIEEGNKFISIYSNHIEMFGRCNAIWFVLFGSNRSTKNACVEIYARKYLYFRAVVNTF